MQSLQSTGVTEVHHYPLPTFSVRVFKKIFLSNLFFIIFLRISYNVCLDPSPQQYGFCYQVS